MKPLLLVDANYLACRSAFAFAGLAATSGEPTGALYGFLCEVLRLKQKCSPRLVFCWDCPRSETWRRKLFAGYKANRRMDSDVAKSLYPQIDLLQRVMPMLGYASVLQDRLEGDDLIAAYCAANQGSATVIYSTDHDLFQLLGPGVTQIVGKRSETQQSVEREYGVPISMWAQYLALGGDSSDGITVRGMGPKTAQRYLQDGVDLDRPLADQPTKYYGKLSRHWSHLQRAFVLTQLVGPDVETRVRAQGRLLSWVSYYQPQQSTRQGQKQFTQFCKKYELVEFLGRRSQFFYHGGQQSTGQRAGSSAMAAQLL